MKTIVIVNNKDDAPLAYIVDGDLREEDGEIMSGDLWLMIYELEPIDYQSIPNYIKSYPENIYCICVTEE